MTMPDTTEPRRARGGVVGFLTTIPGILTGLAALVTAAGTIYVGAHQAGSTETAHTERPTTTATATVTSTATPQSPPQSPGSPPPSTSPAAPPDRIIDQPLQLSDPSDLDIANSDPVWGLIDRCTSGDVSACEQILVELAQECAGGSGVSCDVLFEVSPPGTVYEAYGATCGARVGEEYADTCGDLW